MKATAQMGQYEIYEIIGKGGLATIFLARDTSQGPESPLMALKCMNPEAANHQMAVQGFFQEIKLLRSFQHQNLLTGEDSGKQRGVHYVVTQFIDGQNLRSINNKPPHPSLAQPRPASSATRRIPQHDTQLCRAAKSIP